MKKANQPQVSARLDPEKARAFRVALSARGKTAQSVIEAAVDRFLKKSS